jgi:hypothetical protein
VAEEIGWWKCKHGAPFNGNFAPVAEIAKATRGEVANVDYALRDCASKAKDRGSIADFNAAYVSACMQIKLSKVQAILAAMRSLRIIENDRMPSFDDMQQIGSSTHRVRRWRAAKRDETHVTPVTLHATRETHETQSQSQESESESEKIEERDDSARQRARAGAASRSEGGRGLPAHDAERALEVDCRALVEGLPVSVDTNFVPILRLIDAGLTREDILGGVREAVELRAIRARSWSVFERFIREKAKDRLERAIGRPGGRPSLDGLSRVEPVGVVVDLKPRERAGPRPSNLAIALQQLAEIRAEEDRGAGGLGL